MRPRTNQFKYHLGWTIVVDDSMILLLNLYPKGPNEHAVSNPSFIICRAMTYEVMKEEEDALLKFWHCSG